MRSYGPPNKYKKSIGPHININKIFCNLKDPHMNKNKVS